jgi:predicted alpha/beta hydrolase family esterase
MQDMTVIFSHGRESGPWGTKIRALARIAEQHGLRVVSRDDRDTQDPDLRVSRLVDEACAIDQPIVLVGSSMGGYVATLASRQVNPVGLFLMAPAFGLPGYAEKSPCPVCRDLTIVHGWNDSIVPIEAVFEFSRKHHAMLHLVPAGHALLEELSWLTRIFELFLGRCLRAGARDQRGRLLATI